ncbi:MAG: hypothetical protein KC621_30855 [Myxococcales bacterium]|nr:hypothetical protein [Myxococcales bacterium]
MTDLDEWWGEQAARQPRRFQVWRAPRARPTVLLLATDDAPSARRRARRSPPSLVVDTQTRDWPLVIQASGGERGPWADTRRSIVPRLVAAAEALRRLPIGEPIRRRLGLSVSAARRAAEDLRRGAVRFRGRFHPLPCGPAEVVLDLVGGCLRRTS